MNQLTPGQMSDALKQMAAEYARLRESSYVPKHELKILVFVAYTCGQITQHRASEMLGVKMKEFYQEWAEWLEGDKRMMKIWEGLD